MIVGSNRGHLNRSSCGNAPCFPPPKSGRQMKALRQKLQKHAVTRQWVGLDSDKQAVSQDEQEPLGGLLVGMDFPQPSDLETT